MNKDVVKYGLAAIVIITLTVGLSLIIDGFWDGYGVEFAGVVLELGLIYLLLDKCLKRNAKKKFHSQRLPVMVKLREHVTVLHVFTFRALATSLDKLTAYEKGYEQSVEFADTDNPEQFDAKVRQLNDLLSHASNHLSVEEYGKLLDYVDYMRDLSYFVGWVRHHPLDVNDHAKNDFAQEIGWGQGLRAKYKVTLREDAILESVKFYEWLKGNSEPSPKPFFRTPVIKLLDSQLPDATRLVEKARKLKSINLLEVLA